ncbi:thiamine-phosphate kinase [Geminocystis sp. NIES-3709]|uniref:thiamine-phosphate kinase n=1 Tax=Geminocystis sp. NIES-3709 TaxID=1617448 RepID=UPI0005FCAE11|nr:thiamine-phosphate kinase [Geminocystis sp. NIES-3709]BAQ63884.1 thiamine-monophosphate kinase [Geminocystis sp. NIES-3709]
MLKVKDIGEHQLLAIINQYCDQAKNGDDGAILDISTHKKLVVTTDILVENVHFSDRTTPPHSIGYRAVAANLSDIAAMGGTPKAITVGLSLKKDTEISWIEAVYQGMKQCLTHFNCTIVGGDITSSVVNTIAITALGEVHESEAIYRHTAQAGDLIVITGSHGLARAGLEMLLYPEKYSHVSSKTKEKVILAHQYPQPRLDVIKTLANCKPYGKITGMDSSDGLADAIIQICNKSKMGAIVNLRKIPIDSGILAMTDFDTALHWTLYGGEDFELILCVDSDIAYKLKQQLSQECQIIGEITTPCEIQLVDEQNVYSKLLLNQKNTYQHF